MDISKILEKHKLHLNHDKENGAVADFADMNLAEYDFSNADLRYAVFNRTNLEGANFENTNLSRAKFEGADLRRSKFRGANLTGAYFGHANLRQADLESANLAGTMFTEANLTEASLAKTNLQYSTDLTGANLYKVDLTSTIGNLVEIKSLQLDELSITYTDELLRIGSEQHFIFKWWEFNDRDFEISAPGYLEYWKKHKDLLRQIIETFPARSTKEGLQQLEHYYENLYDNWDLTEMWDLSSECISIILEKHKRYLEHDAENGVRADFADIRLEGINFSGLDLRDVRFERTILERADFKKADLSGAYFVGADLRRANLAEANLSGASLNDAILCGANLDGANVEGANLSGAYLSEASLSSIDFHDTILTGANLYGARLSKVVGNMKEIKNLELDGWSIAYTAEELCIGCEQHFIYKWWEFEDKAINDMHHEALAWWKKNKETLKQIIETSPAVSSQERPK